MPSQRRLVFEMDGEDVVFEILKTSVVVGRDRQADLAFDDPGLSKRHCEFLLEDDMLVLRDLGSTNGTFLNGVQISNALVRAGDVVSVGDRTLHVDRRKDAPLAAATPAAASGGGAPKVASSATAAAVRAPAPNEAAAEAPTRPALARPRSGGKKTLVAAAILVVGAFVVVKFRPKDDLDPNLARLAEGRARLAAIVAAAPDVGRRATETALDELEADYGPIGLRPEISRRRDALAAAFAERPANGAPKTPETQNGVGEVPPAEAPDAAALEFETAFAARDFLAAAKAAERSNMWASLRRKLDAALATERAEVEKAFVDVAARQGAEAARDLLSERLKAFPVGSTAYSELQVLLLRDAVAQSKRPPPKDASASAPVAERDVPPGDALKSRLSEAEKLLDDGRVDEALAAAAALAEEGDKGGHRSFRAAAERVARRATAENAFKAAIARALSEGARPDVPSGDGGAAPAVAAGAEGIVFERDGVKATVPWRVAPVATFAALAEKLPLTAAERVAAAACLFARQKEEVATRLLVRACDKATKEERAAVDRTVADARGVAVPTEGFKLVDGKFLSPAELRRHELNQAVAKAKKDFEGNDATKRREAFEALVALGDDAKASLHAALIARRSALDQALKSDGTFRKIAAIHEKRLAIDKMREELLGLIFDEKAYPYPYRPPAATPEQYKSYLDQQKIIDVKTFELRKAWDDKDSIKAPPSYLDKLARLSECVAWIAEVGAAASDPEPGFYTLPPKDGEFSVRSMALDSAERERLDASIGIMAKNETEPGALRGEIDQARITNDYRLMMGRRAVILYAPLVRAARDHCADMSKLGFFAHESPVPGKTRPWDRMRLAGVEPIGGSENIAVAGGPQGAFDGWRRSSGHHRNMIEKDWRYIGVGNNGRNWCQLFVVGDRKLAGESARADDGGDSGGR